MANYSICIGVSDYDRDSKLPPLKYAHKDAQDLHELFIKYKFEESLLFRSHGSEYQEDENVDKHKYRHTNANYTQIYRFLSRSFSSHNGQKKRFTRSDNLWFFFSGHGREYKR